MKLDKKPGEWEDRLVLFTGFLVDNQLQSFSVRSYISAIKSVLLESNIKIEENKFLLNSLTRACKVKNDILVTRLPIQKDLVHALLRQTEKLFNKPSNTQPYLEIMYKALLVATYYGLLRIGEVTQSIHVLLARNENKNKLPFMLNTSKTHDLGSPPQMIKISQKLSRKEKMHELQEKYNPFNLIRAYLHRRLLAQTSTEQFFVFSDNTPVKPCHFRLTLKTLLSQLKFQTDLYVVHGLRGERACDLMKYGLSVETIKKLGRWKSNAVFAYLKN